MRGLWRRARDGFGTRRRFALLACLVVAVAAAWPAVGVGRPLVSAHRLAKADYGVVHFRFTQAGVPYKRIRNIIETLTAGSGTISEPGAKNVDLTKPGATFRGPASGTVVLQVDRLLGRTQTITMDVTEGSYLRGTNAAGA
jgi:hypothetical protein